MACGLTVVRVPEGVQRHEFVPQIVSHAVKEPRKPQVTLPELGRAGLWATTEPDVLLSRVAQVPAVLLSVIHPCEALSCDKIRR